jgi:putative transposase
MTAARRRMIVAGLCERFNVSRRRAARALDLPRSSLRHAPVARDEQAVLARRIWALLDREGWSVNMKAARRIWRLSGLKLARPRATVQPRRPHGQESNACHLRPSRGQDEVWTWDFLRDRTSDGRGLKWLSLVDEYTRECLALEARRGMTAEAARSWREGTGSGTLYVAPGSPWRNGDAESFHGTLRDEFLDREEFASGSQARALGTLWKEAYHAERPHGSLGDKTPAEFAATCGRRLPIEKDPTERLPTEQPHR